MKIQSKIMIGILTSSLMIALQGMEPLEGDTPDSFGDQVMREVDYLFSYCPIFSTALEEDEKTFNGHLDAFRNEFCSRIENNSVQQNSAFIQALQKSIANQKDESFAIISQQFDGEVGLSGFKSRVDRIEHVVRDFIASHEIRKSGDWESPVPIFQGKDIIAARRPQAVAEAAGSLLGGTRSLVVGLFLVIGAGYLFSGTSVKLW